MDGNRLLKLISVYFFICSCSYFSFANQCINLFSKSRSQYAIKAKKNFPNSLSIELYEKLSFRARNLFESEKLSEADKYELLFHDYMKLRVEYLPEDIRENVLKIVGNMKISSFKPTLIKKEVSGGVRELFGLMQLDISLPDYIHKTPIDYAIRVHELEHIIQIYIVGVGSATQYLFPKFVNDRHAVEEGAMRSEGTFLSLIPKDIIQNYLDKYSEKSKSSKLAKHMLAGSLLTENSNQYLEFNWEQGRYSISELRFYQLLNYAIFPGGIIPVIFLGHILGF